MLRPTRFREFAFGYNLLQYQPAYHRLGTKLVRKKSDFPGMSGVYQGI